LFHYLVGLYPDTPLSIGASLATVGYVEILNSFEYIFSVPKMEHLFSSFELVCMTDKTLALNSRCEIANNELIVSFQDFSVPEKTVSLVVLGVLPNGKKNKLASITFCYCQTIPEVTLIVGAPRSGTSALGAGLRKASKFKGHGESHVAPLLQQIVAMSSEHFTFTTASKNRGTLAYDITATHIESELLEAFRRIHRSFYGEQFFIYKTPGIPMIKALPALMRAYPQAKVIFCKRRGIENVRSRVKKFPKVEFSTHCQQWGKTFENWRKAQKEISSMLGHHLWELEVEQFELASAPEIPVASIAAHLSFNEKQRVDMLDFIRSKRPQSSFIKGATSLTGTGWNDAQIAVFKKICGKEMQKQGYSYTEDYYANKNV
jgi:hypothetical protein